MRPALLLALVFALVAASMPAAARPLPDGGVLVEEVGEVMRIAGYPVEQTTDRQGDPLIWSRVDGRRFAVFFYECRKPRCISLQFSAGFRDSGVDQDQVADWNRRKRFGRAYLGREDVLYVEMDMDVERGATTEALANNLERWKALLADFVKELKL